jgi:hypothetical protein
MIARREKMNSGLKNRILGVLTAAVMLFTLYNLHCPIKIVWSYLTQCFVNASQGREFYHPSYRGQNPEYDLFLGFIGSGEDICYYHACPELLDDIQKDLICRELNYLLYPSKVKIEKKLNPIYKFIICERTHVSSLEYEIKKMGLEKNYVCLVKNEKQLLFMKNQEKK